MVDLLSLDEGVPSSYPALPSNVSTDAANAIDAATVWRRIDDWIRYRWNERDVTLVLRGPGNWIPSLQPFTVDSASVWNDSTRAYESVTLKDAPVGYELDCKAYKIEGTAGTTDTPPDIVQEAVRRLTEYLYQVMQDPALGNTSATDGDYSFDRPANWAPRAIHYSGAADLLRAYR